MPVLNKKALSYLLLLVWLSLVFIAAYYFISKRLTEFDPHNQLEQFSASGLGQQLQQQLFTQPLAAQTIVHISRKGCDCNPLNQAHKQDINQLAQSYNFDAIELDISELDTELIPSTPALLVLDKQQQLLYFGPYSQGFACTEANGFVAAVLKNYQHGFNSELVVSQAKGCYCQS